MNDKHKQLIGIDYGSNLAGTTVIACYDNNTLSFYSSEKKKSADTFLKEKLHELKAKKVFIDAPLSLPLAYFDKGNDYFFRSCDKELKCMSPMFLGGLTARAMRLKNELADIEFIETYPSFHAKRLSLKQLNYKKQKEHIPEVLTVIKKEFPFDIPEKLASWHYVDALLCLLTAVRYTKNEHQSFGTKEEGIIIV